ncbi:MAG: hypothetical protein Hals2KO_33700 [Halioglobus sp.]
MQIHVSVFGLFGVGAGRYRVDPAFVPGVASREAFHGKYTASDYAVCFDSFLGITGAAGIKAAMVTEEWTDAEFIAAD